MLLQEIPLNESCVVARPSSYIEIGIITLATVSAPEKSKISAVYNYIREQDTYIRMRVNIPGSISSHVDPLCIRVFWVCEHRILPFAARQQISSRYLLELESRYKPSSHRARRHLIQIVMNIIH
jgi:hypothetical protein